MKPSSLPTDPSRRVIILGAGGILLAADKGRAASPDIEPAMRRAEALRAAAAAAGDQAFGAVVVKDGKVVGDGPSKVITDQDPTAHAEMVAIRDAARRLGTRDLSGCLLVSTFHPCPMCETAAYWAGIARLIHGAGLTDAGRPRYGGC